MQSLEEETEIVFSGDVDEAPVELPPGAAPDSLLSSCRNRVTGDGATEQSQVRQGTTASARFNMLSTMVGGGSLSLPLAFSKSGNALFGPVFLVGIAFLTEFCFRVHVGSARLLSPVSPTRPGHDSFESIAAQAFGPRSRVFSTALVTAMCFFGTVGYAVLLRDMLQPVTNAVWQLAADNAPGNSASSYLLGHSTSSSGSSNTSSGPSWHNNLIMLTVVFAVTPLCTLQTLTSLQKFGATSMLSVLILGSCVLYRSIECNWGIIPPQEASDVKAIFQLFPDSWKDVLDVFPLYVSCFVCHYNLLPVHNELRNPTAPRVTWWLRSTVWSAALFYLVMGLAGSAYGHCTGRPVSGNVLLDFPDDDPLLLVGRLCLAITISLAFPMLTIPARDILLRSSSCWTRTRLPREASPTTVDEMTNDGPYHPATITNPLNVDNADALTEAMLPPPRRDIESPSSTGCDGDANDKESYSLGARLLAAVLVFWSAAAVASCVSSIDVVWELLGSSLSILLSYLIPCGAYLLVAHQVLDGVGSAARAAAHDLSVRVRSKWLARILIAVFVPLMVVSTVNAVHNTFFDRHGADGTVPESNGTIAAATAAQ